MSTITRERLEWLSKISGRDDIDEIDGEEIRELARTALASLEAEAVAWLYSASFERGQVEGELTDAPGCDMPVYTAPPAPVSVPDLTALNNLAGEMLNHAMNCERRVAVAYTHCAHRLAEEVRDLRSAMLQGAENAKSPTTMQTEPALDSSPKIAESTSGNSPVIPDCSCGTCRPVTFTDSRFVVCSECGNKRCPHANDHRNACTGSNEPGQKGSAYPAAPQQEVTQALAKGMERYGDAMQELAKKEVK